MSRLAGVVLLAMQCLSAVALAQAPAIPPTQPVVTATRPWYFDALIVVVMMGLALFVVCRSARRN